MNPITPPANDEERERHKFYLAITHALNSFAQGQERAFSIMAEMDKSVKEHHKFQTKVYTVGSVIIAIWFAISGIVGWYANRLVGGYDLIAAKVETMERKLEINDLKAKPLEAIPDKVDALRSRVSRLEDLAEQRGAK